MIDSGAREREKHENAEPRKHHGRKKNIFQAGKTDLSQIHDLLHVPADITLQCRNLLFVAGPQRGEFLLREQRGAKGEKAAEKDEQSAGRSRREGPSS